MAIATVVQFFTNFNLRRIASQCSNFVSSKLWRFPAVGRFIVDGWDGHWCTDVF
jgi:hypothetical protein